MLQQRLRDAEARAMFQSKKETMTGSQIEGASEKEDRQGRESKDLSTSKFQTTKALVTYKDF